ncbi:CLUMA_CG021029, isoform A [Clunio marinus]|uniref:CLUMA_CG021029, isoform A n=1 Tax=Clunio marinus TaxID=568069 RepID=A0A1J1J8E5_9DIPT|nr:CLUMA_CG021029, isoform A [Clunio marinus]
MLQYDSSQITIDSKHQITSVPKFGLKFKFNHKFPDKEKFSQNLKPSWKQIWDLVPMMFRYVPYYWKNSQTGQPILMDYFSMQNSLGIYGCPIGGIGAGTIGRGFAGEFCRYQLRPGIYEYNTLHANQFIVNIKDENGSTIFQSVMSTFDRAKSCFSSWESNLDPEKCLYTALYPRSWSEYDLSEYGVKLVCRQISPVIPHNYKDSSFPCAVFVWQIENICSKIRHVSVTFVIKNGTGNKKQDAMGMPKSETFKNGNICGATIKQTIAGMPCNYSIGVLKSSDNVSVSSVSKLDPNGNGSTLWKKIYSDGLVSLNSEDKKIKDRKEVCVAVSGQRVIEPYDCNDLEFCFAWDMPKVTFPKSSKTYSKFYTKYFGSDGNAGEKILDYALKSYFEWEQLISNEFQRDILNDPNLPDWYKSAIFNELYFIADGGSLWITVDEDDPLETNDPSLLHFKLRSVK